MSSPLTVLQLTDPHLHTNRDALLRKVKTWHSFERVLDHVFTHHASIDAIVVTGDLAQDERPSTYRMLGERMRSAGCPVLFVAGNHDDPDAMRAALDVAPMSCAPHFDLGMWRLHLLQTRVPRAIHGVLAQEDLDRLRTSLADLNAPPHSALFLHHPPFPVGPDWLDGTRLQNAAELLSLTRATHRAKALACGHVHLAFETEDHGMWMASTPSTGAQFHPVSDTYKLDSRPPGYRVLRLFDDGRVASDVVWIAAAAG